MASKRKRARRPTRPTVAVQLPFGGHVIDVQANFPGNTPQEQLFGPPPVVLAEHGQTKVTDEKEHMSHSLDLRFKRKRPYADYEAFYTYAGGGVVGYITKKPSGPWKLSCTMYPAGLFPEPEARPQYFPTWQAAWAYVVEHL